MARSIKHTALALLSLLILACNDNVRVIVHHIPSKTPVDDPIYITGNFNNWNPADPIYRLYRNEDGQMEVSLPAGIGEVEYKFTRGDWSTEDVDSCGNPLDNRIIEDLSTDELQIKLHQWKDLPECICEGIELYIRVPESTPVPNEIYVSSDICGWCLAEETYRASYLGSSIYKLVLPSTAAGHEYKINRGTWNTVEIGPTGREIQNRLLTDDPIQRIVVSGWKDIHLQENPYRYVVLHDIPSYTPSNARFFFASNINNWDPQVMEYEFTPLDSSRWIVRIPNATENIEFKVTRGHNWSTVETGEKGGEIRNREIQFNLGDTVFIKVHNWKDLGPLAF